jgi:hypothetical protein
MEIPTKKSGVIKTTEEASVKTIDLVTGDSSKTVIISTQLFKEQESTLTKFLRDNRYIFTRKPAGMPSLPRELAEHKLELKLGSKQVKKRLRQFALDKKKAIKKRSQRYYKSGSSGKSSIPSGSQTRY